jgi:hypothetical protein
LNKRDWHILPALSELHFWERTTYLPAVGANSGTGVFQFYPRDLIASDSRLASLRKKSEPAPKIFTS